MCVCVSVCVSVHAIDRLQTESITHIFIIHSLLHNVIEIGVATVKHTVVCNWIQLVFDMLSNTIFHYEYSSLPSLHNNIYNKENPFKISLWFYIKRKCFSLLNCEMKCNKWNKKEIKANNRIMLLECKVELFCDKLKKMPRLKLYNNEIGTFEVRSSFSFFFIQFD